MCVCVCLFMGNVPWKRPLEALFPTAIKNLHSLGLRSRACLTIYALCDRRGRYFHAFGICAPFNCIYQKNMQGGMNIAARGLISRDIAYLWICLFWCKCVCVFANLFVFVIDLILNRGWIKFRVRCKIVNLIFIPFS